jgi:hypothetical protein
MTAQLETFMLSPAGEWSSALPGHLDSDQTLVLVFGASKFLDDSSRIQELTRVFPSSHFLGCSTSGEIRGASLYDQCLSVAVMRFQTTCLRSVDFSLLKSASTTSHMAGCQIANSLMEVNGEQLRGVLVLSDGLITNGSALIAGLNSVLPPSVVVTGGLAGDGTAFHRTWVLHEGRPQSGVVTAIGLYGDHVSVHHGCRGGWDIFGPERLVTRSEGSVLYELDGKPALELYKKYLGVHASGLPATGLHFPLSLKTGSSESVVRTILAIDEQAQTLTFAGDIIQGSMAQLMKANFNRLIDGASAAAMVVQSQFAGTPEMPKDLLSIAISCVGRRIVLGEYVEDELEAVLDFLPAGTQQVGFYSYGEISPQSTGHCDFHNQTMTLTTIWEQ